MIFEIIKFITCFQDIVNNLFTSQNFSTMDVNSDGSLTIDEFFDELMAMPWPVPAGTYLQAYSGSSDVSILNAALCICDTDSSASLDINEMTTDQCQLVQNWMLGKVSLQGVDSLWSDSTFIPVDWVLGIIVVDLCYFALFEDFSL